VQGTLWGVRYILAKVDGLELSLVKDTGACMTLVCEDLVDPKCILQGQTTTLFTAIGQPFETKFAVVNLKLQCLKVMFR
jgi:hypothetical protein